MESTGELCGNPTSLVMLNKRQNRQEQKNTIMTKKELTQYFSATPYSRVRVPYDKYDYPQPNLIKPRGGTIREIQFHSLRCDTDESRAQSHGKPWKQEHVVC